MDAMKKKPKENPPISIMLIILPPITRPINPPSEAESWEGLIKMQIFGIKMIIVFFLISYIVNPR